MTAKLYAADVDGKPTGDVLMQTTLGEGWAWAGDICKFADINWKDGSIKDYEIQSGTKYVIEISSAAHSYYSGFLEDYMGWCENHPITYEPSNQYWWTPNNWWTDSGYICLFRNFGE